MDNATTLVETMNALRTKGYTEDFNVKLNGLACAANDIYLHPDDFAIDEVFRFYGDSDPDDESVLYAVSSEMHNLKGVLVNSFGIYADSMSSELAAKLHFH